MKRLLFALLFYLLISGCEEKLPTDTDEKDKPKVEIISPTNNSLVKDSVLIKVKANDDKGIVQLEIFIDNKTDGARTFFFEPYKYMLILPPEPDSAKHKIYAKAYDGDNNMTSSNVIDIYHVLIESPSDLGVNTISEDSLELIWKDNSNDEEGFLIERRIDHNDKYRVIATASANDTSYIDVDIYKMIGYQYRIRSFSYIDTSSYSPVLWVRYLNRFSLFGNIYRIPGDENFITPISIIPGTKVLIYAFQNRNNFFYRHIESLSDAVFSLENPEDKITCIETDSSGKVLIGTNTGNIYLKEAPNFNNTKVFFIENNKITDVVFLKNHPQFAAASASGKITIFDYEQQTILSSYINSENSGKLTLEYNPIDNILFNGSSSGYLIEWNVSENSVERKTNLSSPIYSLAFNPNLQKLYIGLGTGYVRVIDTQTHYLALGVNSHRDAVTDIKICPINDDFITASNDGLIKFWNKTRKNYSIINYANLKKSISVDATNNFNYVITSSENLIYLWKNAFGWYKQ